MRHGDHTDYLHDGHLHHPHEGNVDEHVIDVFGANTDDCTPDHRCGGHDSSHVHGLSCGHEAVPHGNHVDYRVAGHLHHPHGDHCDDHGQLGCRAMHPPAGIDAFLIAGLGLPRSWIVNPIMIGAVLLAGCSRVWVLGEHRLPR